jgi:hypothetical protein
MEIIRLQNRNTMEEVQPASSSGNFCADSPTANTSSFLASNTEFSSGQLRSQYHNSLTTVLLLFTDMADVEFLVG